MKLRIFVLYDSVQNSVFEGQVLEPLSIFLRTHHDYHVILISFEKKESIPVMLMRRITHFHPRFSSVFLVKKWFWRIAQLNNEIKQLHKVLISYRRYELIARGPLAGYIAQHAIDPTQCKALTIQARGLLAEEHAYQHNKDHFLIRFMHTLRTRQYHTIEKKAYQFFDETIPFIVLEAVSPSLKEFLHSSFKIPLNRIVVAKHDIPPRISTNKKEKWRTSVRSYLNIPLCAYVYVYNGSSHAWQCPEKTIAFFAQKSTANPHLFLLIISPDLTTFEKLIKKYHIPGDQYRIISVSYKTIYPYLAAADEGILFRKKHIMNWIARPTKMLEYHAVGLPIAHNNTVAWLCRP